jgi:hypothetical protein
MLNKNIVLRFAPLALALLMSSPAMASTLLSTLYEAAYPGIGFGGNPDSADQFTTGDTPLTVQSIDFSWWAGNSGTSDRLGIFADDSGFPGAVQVGTWFTSSAPTADHSTITYSGSASLLANTTYFLVVDTDDSSRPSFTRSSSVFSDPSTLGATNPVGAYFGNTIFNTWTMNSVNLLWQLNGLAAVPEPATVALTLSGLAALLAFCLRSGVQSK